MASRQLTLFDLPRLYDCRPWTVEEFEIIREAYSGSRSLPVQLTALALRLGRARTAICRHAQKMGLTNMSRKKHTRFPLPMASHSPEELAAMTSERTKKYIAEHGHARGMAGKKHTPEFKRKMSERLKEICRDPNATVNSQAQKDRRSAVMRRLHREGKRPAIKAYSRCRMGHREDIGIYVRSSWEANYARYLNSLKELGDVAEWSYEPVRFEFPETEAPTSYQPDFKVTFSDGRIEWHEVKGWMTEKGQKALDRMAQYHPEQVLVLRDKNWFNGPQGKAARLLPNWEKAL